MMRRLAAHLRSLDPRLKTGVCLLCGPGVWLLQPMYAAALSAILAVLALPLALTQPLGRGMLRRLCWFVLLWTAIKLGLDLLSGAALAGAARDGLVLAVRLSALLMLGLVLSLSTSAHSLGLALVWALRPVIGRERAWRAALSLALMVHFLPLCLSTLDQVSTAFRSRCPGGSLAQRALIVPLAVIRGLGQRTWNQALAVAGRGLDRAEAWEPGFAWSSSDTFWLAAVCATMAAILI